MNVGIAKSLLLQFANPYAKKLILVQFNLFLTNVVRQVTLLIQNL